MLKAKGNEVLDETGKQLCVVLATNCTKQEAQRWAQYIVDHVNANERSNSATAAKMTVEGNLVPTSVLEALRARLSREPASSAMLEDLAMSLEVPLSVRMRVVDRWLQQNRKAGLIHFKARKWHWDAAALQEVAS